MWELKAIEIGSKKLDAQINVSDTDVEIEAPYFKTFKDTDTIKIDKQTYTIKSAVNVGNRNETIIITTMEKDNEHKQVKIGKATDV
jgi:hypothetical protein|tara:strand:+ start:132 stop:389 length:258 start_codon:yes stop_codon:yes gene_type:complete